MLPFKLKQPEILLSMHSSLCIKYPELKILGEEEFHKNVVLLVQWFKKNNILTVHVISK